jgi:hypothetical protein
MPRQEVISKCAAAGYTVSEAKPKDGTILFVSTKHVYTTQFQDDHLTYADREWYSSETDLDAFQTAIVAMGALSDKNSSPCTIVNQPLNTPSTQATRIFLWCGKRSLLLVDMKMSGKHYYSVQERIGEMLPGK